MKANAIVRIIIYGFAILLLSGILISVLFFGMYFEGGRVHSRVDDNHIAPTEGMITQYQFSDEIKNIDIDWVSGSIVIRPRETVNGIHVAEFMGHDVTETMVCKQSGQTLKIEFCEDSIKLPSIGFSVNYSKDLVIDVPADWICNSLEIDTASAEVEIENLTIDEFDFDGASGICTLNNCNVEEMDVDTASGNIFFTGKLDRLNCDAASADCSVTVFNAPRSIKMNAASGDLELVLPPDTGFTCKMETLSGDFDSDFEFGTVGETYIHGNGDCDITMCAMSGDVSILKGVNTPVIAGKNCDH